MPYVSGDSESEALDDIMENGNKGWQYGDGEFFGLPHRPTLRDYRAATAARVISKERMLTAYETAKAAKTGALCVCPTCKKQFTKKSYQQAFCSNKGRNNCKDTFWNRASFERSQRAQYFAGKR